MSIKVNWSNIQILHDAPRLVRWGIEHGFLSYPRNQRFHADGSLDPMLLPEEEVSEHRHTPEIIRKAFNLRERGLSLNDVAAACGVPRGSVVYLISKGHEQFLSEQRKDVEP